MSDQPPAKRRRLDSALHKPFRSPLRHPLEPKCTNTRTQSPLALDSKLTTQTTPSVLKQSRTTIQPSAFSTNTRTGLRLTKSSPLRPTAAVSADQQTRILEARIRAARADIDVLNQALKILHSPRRDELPALIQKWRRAARLAAEDVYAEAQEKVNQMGGFGALRDRERERVQRRREWDRLDREKERADEIKRLKAEGVDMREFLDGREDREEELEEEVKEAEMEKSDVSRADYVNVPG
jgi:Swi5-dependent recombination DNA repair protein 1